MKRVLSYCTFMTRPSGPPICKVCRKPLGDSPRQPCQVYDTESFTPPVLPEKDINTLAVVTCHYNPQGYTNIRENYWRFRESMERQGAHPLTAELVFGDSEPEISDAEISVRGTERNVLWQKERLLNLLIQKVQGADAIAWVDADVIFENDNWVEDTCKVLSTKSVVQLFDWAYVMLKDGSLDFSRESTASLYDKGDMSYRNFMQGHPGFAWAGRSDWMKAFGLEDAHITGGGDSLMVEAMIEARNITKILSEDWLNYTADWSIRACPVIQKALGVVKGNITHLYHGSREKRRYMDRWLWLNRGKYNPRTDLTTEASGIWRWSDSAWEHKQEMIKDVANYFAIREEDT